MSFVEACRELISIDSTPAHGNHSAVMWLAEYCRKKGLEVEVLEDRNGDVLQANILIQPSGAKISEGLSVQPQFLLQTHLDTVDSGPFPLWEKTGCNPFDAHIIDGRIYGLGAANTKLDFLCKIEAISKFKDSKWKLTPILLGTYGEETGMQGALKIIRKNKINAKQALIGEPSEFNLIYAAKGIAQVEIRVPFSQGELEFRQEHNLRESTSTQSRMFSGKSAHCSNPQLGESAIRKMLEYLAQLPESINVMELDGGSSFNTVPSHAFLEVDLVSVSNTPLAKKISSIYKAIQDLENKFKQFPDQDFHPATATLNIGMVRTFDYEIVFSGTCRIPPNIAQETYEQWMMSLSKSCDAVGARFTVTDYKRPYRNSAESDFFKVCLGAIEKLGRTSGKITQSSTNESSLFSRIGIECIGFGPGERENNLHTPSESVALKDLEDAVKFYENVIQGMCL